MIKAWNNVQPRLAAEGKISAGRKITLQPSHIYIRFLPKDSIEFEMLEKTEGIELYDYPFDYEIEDLGQYYHDPTIPVGQPTWQYTVLEVGFQIPRTVKYEILEKLFLPEASGVSVNLFPSDENPCEIPQRLVNEAMIITDNADEVVPISENCGGGSPGTGGGTSCVGCPRGQILVENPDFGNITRVENGEDVEYDGVPNVKARARRWFNIKTAQTNDEGIFVINHNFGKAVNLSIKYTNVHAMVKPVAIGFGPALLNGPKQKGFWEYRSKQGSGSYLWGAIMRGVDDYHNIYAPQFNIGTPPNDIKFKACANNECGLTTMLHQTATFKGLFGRWLFSDIRVGSKDTPYRRLYEVTIHELGHAAHWKLAGDWNIGNNWKMIWAHQRMREAWACAIADEAIIDKFGAPWYGVCSGTDDRVLFDEMVADKYPRIFVRDLIDDINEFDANNDRCDDLQDNVEGFTLSQAFYALEDAFAWKNNTAMDKWRDNLADRIPAQSDNLDEYFEQWEK